MSLHSHKLGSAGDGALEKSSRRKIFTGGGVGDVLGDVDGVVLGEVDGAVDGWTLVDG